MEVSATYGYMGSLEKHSLKPIFTAWMHLHFGHISLKIYEIIHVIIMFFY